MKIMRTATGFLVVTSLVGQPIYHAVVHPLGTRLDQVVVPITMTSTATASFSQSITDTLLEDRAYPRPQPERPQVTQRST